MRRRDACSTSASQDWHKAKDRVPMMASWLPRGVRVIECGRSTTSVPAQFAHGETRLGHGHGRFAPFPRLGLTLPGR